MPAAQNGQTVTYNLDPVARVRERVTSGSSTSDAVDHFSDTSDSPSWTATGTAWSRNVAGIGGELAAIQSSTGTTTIQIMNLHGDVVGTVADSTTATAPTLAQHTDEFGAPYAGKTPARYDWLGGHRRTTAIPSGLIDMGEREYMPELGRFLQTDPVAGGSANSYDYVNQDPVNQFDFAGTASAPGGCICDDARVNAALAAVAGAVAIAAEACIKSQRCFENNSKNETALHHIVAQRAGSRASPRPRPRPRRRGRS
jgi:RHS repeat-associated protein